MAMIPAAVDASPASTQCSPSASLSESERNTLTCAAGDDFSANANDASAIGAMDPAVLL